MRSSETPRIALTIAGSDSGGGAGIQADLKTFAAHGVFGTSAVTAITAQNTRGVSEVISVPLPMIRSQLRALKEDLPQAAVKTGMLYDADTVRAVAHWLGRPPMPLVVDPVLSSSSGTALMEDEGLEAYRSALIPLASVFTPNLFEASRFLGISPIDNIEAMHQACVELLRLGCRSVLLKGGHLPGDTCMDLFYDGSFLEMPSPRIHSPNTHGTGCTLSAALCANLALGHSLREAATRSKDYLNRSLQGAARWHLGQGSGPLNHFPE